MNRRFFGILIAVLALSGVFAAVFLHRGVPPSQTPPAPSDTALPGAPYPPPSSLPLAKTANEARAYAIQNTLKDAQGNPVDLGEGSAHDFRLADESGYSIDYQVNYDLFFIAIKQLPFDQNRQAAEKRLIQILNTPPGIACQLNVQIVVPARIDLQHSGTAYPLSFCR